MPQMEFDTSALGPGTYRIGVTASGSEYVPASSEVAITVKEYQPPTGTVRADPAEIYAGDKSALAASFNGQCGGQIQPPSFSASEGTVQGSEFDSSSVQFDPSVRTEQRKAVTITASAADSRNTGSATTSITVIQKASAAAIRLPDILFPTNSARVNNCGKRVLLEQLRSYFERDPGGKAVLVGHIASGETPARLAEERAQNSAAMITAATGICLSIPGSQVLYSAPGADQNGVDFQPNFCGASAQEGPTTERRGQAVSANDARAKYRRVEVWFVPSGGQPPETTGSYSTAATLSIGCPK
jgi:outer membrane protein OmpA-like peptidoglycan-associated protein